MPAACRRRTTAHLKQLLPECHHAMNEAKQLHACTVLVQMRIKQKFVTPLKKVCNAQTFRYIADQSRSQTE